MAFEIFGFEKEKSNRWQKEKFFQNVAKCSVQEYDTRTRGLATGVPLYTTMQEQTKIHVCVRVRPLSDRERKNVSGRVAWRWGEEKQPEKEVTTKKDDNDGDNDNNDDAAAAAAGGRTAGRAGAGATGRGAATTLTSSNTIKNKIISYIEQIWFPPGQQTRMRSKFFFDSLFGPKMHTLPVYDSVGAPIVKSTMLGFHGAIFCYGQTSTGKTYTMQGSSSHPGLLPLAVEDVFEHVQQHHDKQFVLRMSYLEIYNETVNDLLRPSSMNLRIFDDPQMGVLIKGLEETVVVSPEQVRCSSIIVFEF